MVNEPTKIVTDGLSIGILISTLAEALPAIAAFFTIVWTIIRIYETATVQKFVDKWRKRKK